MQNAVGVFNLGARPVAQTAGLLCRRLPSRRAPRMRAACETADQRPALRTPLDWVRRRTYLFRLAEDWDLVAGQLYQRSTGKVICERIGRESRPV